MSTRKKAPKEEIHAVTRRGEFLRCSTHDPFNKGVGQNNEGLMVIFPTMDLQEIFNLVDSGRTHTSRSSRRLVTRITIKWWCFSKRSPPPRGLFSEDMLVSGRVNRKVFLSRANKKYHFSLPICLQWPEFEWLKCSIRLISRFLYAEHEHTVDG